jgi:hypothetical protein
VLRLLAALGVLTEPKSGSFGLTVLGDRLRSDMPASMRNWAAGGPTAGKGIAMATSTDPWPGSYTIMLKDSLGELGK